MPAATAIHGVVLAGGRGTRMGGVDKGLQLYRGRPLALLAAERLAPQVATLSIGANRHLGVYRSFGWTAWADDPPGDRGPLDGLATAMAHSALPWVAAVPCDSPHLPPDVVERLAAAIDGEAGTAAAIAVTHDADGTRRAHPVVCLLRASLQGDLRASLGAGERRVGAWLRRQRLVEVEFDDADAFANFNTLADLETQGAPSSTGAASSTAACHQEPPWPSM